MRVDWERIKRNKGTSAECQVLSTEMHKSCPSSENCACPHHQTNKTFKQRRPHSYPRLDWAAKKVPGWHEAIKRGEPLPGKGNAKRKMDKQEIQVHEMLIGSGEDKD